MKFFSTKFAAALLAGFLCAGLSAQVEIGPVKVAGSGRALLAAEVVGDGSPEQMPVRIGGGGGAYFYAKTGVFDIDIYYYGYRHGRALLTGPDRSVLADVWFPGTMGGETPPKAPLKLRKVNVRYNNRHEGILALMFVPVNDWYGERMQWGFRTNCKKYVIESSRAHRDARHTDPIELANERPGQICFPAETGKTTIDIVKAVPGVKVSVEDADGRALRQGVIAADGKLSLEVPADPARKGLLRLKMEKLKGKVEIDEVTRWKHVTNWQDASPYCFWTPDPEAWFEMRSIRHALFPFYKEIYLPVGSTADIPFRVRNQSGRDQTYTISVEYPDKKPFLRASKGQFTIKGMPKDKSDGVSDMTVIFRCQPPETGGTHRAHIRCTVNGLSTYSTVILHCRPASERPALAMPFAFPPYRNGADFMIRESAPTGEPYFDHDNKPYAFDHFLRPYHLDAEGKWHRSAMADGSALPRPACTKIAFDQENRIYFIGLRKRTDGKPGNKVVLCWSDNGGKTYKETDFPVNATMADIEVFSGANTRMSPPPILLYDKKSGRKKEAFWQEVNDMYLVIPEPKGSGMSFSKPVKITDRSIGTSLHSGLPCGLVSSGDKVHVIWGEATDPKDKSIKGVPTFVATVDRKSGEMTKPVLLGYGPPANDVHNTPSILIDRKGYLHGFIGSHGLALQYARALKPHSAAEWTAAKPVGNERGGMTYIGAICDRENRLHLIHRQYQTDRDHFRFGFCSELVEWTKDADADAWSGKRVLFRPTFTDYSVFYHRLSIDRQANFFMSLVYWSTYWFYRHDFESRRVVVTSKDSGRSWYLRD